MSVGEFLPAIVVIQLLLTLVLAAVVFGLARQIGVLHERIAPMGAMSQSRGPAVGESAPQIAVKTLQGATFDVGADRPGGRRRLLLFVAPTCPVCKKLLPLVRSFQRDERLDLLLVGDGPVEAQQRMLAEHRLTDVPCAISPALGTAFQVGKLPHAVLIDARGIVRAAGLVNSREHLESLVVAEETGHGNIQSFLAARAQEPAPTSDPASRRNSA